MILSSLIDSQSKILIYRNVRDRVLRVAPFLSLDRDPYPAVIDGRLLWILDGYTTSAYYPYSEREDAGEILGIGQPGSLSGPINYIRNSVKIAVDAYDGRMSFYIIDPNDPIIRVWQKVFPVLFSKGPATSELQQHFRYPEDLFNIQSEVYRTYHMQDPRDFYSKEDAWDIPRASATSTAGQSADFPPTYLLFKMPGDSGVSFLLTRPFTPRGKNNMNAIMLAESDPGRYGRLETLQLPRQSLVPGPSQVDNLINQDVRVSRTKTLLSRAGSRVTFGSLVTLPVGDSLLYVQPFFVQASSGGIPELKKVVVVSGEQVAMRDTFAQSLQELFGVAGQPGGGQGPPPPGQPGGQGGGGPGGAVSAQVRQLIDRAANLYQKAENALSRGDFETYGRLIRQVGRLLSRAQQLSR
jgi:uncharacterized membrane protein (UPF0182 family)